MTDTSKADHKAAKHCAEILQAAVWDKSGEQNLGAAYLELRELAKAVLYHPKNVDGYDAAVEVLIKVLED